MLQWGFLGGVTVEPRASRAIAFYFPKKEKEPNTKIILFLYRVASVMKLGLLTQSYKE